MKSEFLLFYFYFFVSFLNSGKVISYSASAFTRYVVNDTFPQLGKHSTVRLLQLRRQGKTGNSEAIYPD